MRGGDLSEYAKFTGFFIQFVIILISFWLEKLAARGVRINLYVALNLIILTILPVIYVIYFDTHVLFNCAYILNVCIVWFKLISYHHVLNDVRFHLRKAREVGKISQDKMLKTSDFPSSFGLTSVVVNEVLKYPQNITLKQLLLY